MVQTIEHYAPNALALPQTRTHNAKGQLDGQSRGLLDFALLVAVDEPVNVVTNYEYDLVGNPISYGRAESTPTCYRYDALDHLVHVIEPAGTEVDYTYDAVGNLIALRSSSGTDLRFAYDAADTLLSAVDATGRVIVLPPALLEGLGLTEQTCDPSAGPCVLPSPVPEAGTPVMPVDVETPAPVTTPQPQITPAPQPVPTVPPSTPIPLPGQVGPPIDWASRCGSVPIPLCRAIESFFNAISDVAYAPGIDDPPSPANPTNAGWALGPISIGVDFTPGYGDAKGLVEVWTNEDMATGEELGNWRYLGLIGVSELRHLEAVEEIRILSRQLPAGAVSCLDAMSPGMRRYYQRFMVSIDYVVSIFYLPRAYVEAIQQVSSKYGVQIAIRECNPRFGQVCSWALPKDPNVVIEYNNGAETIFIKVTSEGDLPVKSNEWGLQEVTLLGADGVPTDFGLVQRANPETGEMEWVLEEMSNIVDEAASAEAGRAILKGNLDGVPMGPDLDLHFLMMQDPNGNWVHIESDEALELAIREDLNEFFVEHCGGQACIMHGNATSHNPNNDWGDALIVTPNGEIFVIPRREIPSWFDAVGETYPSQPTINQP